MDSARTHVVVGRVWETIWTMQVPDQWGRKNRIVNYHVLVDNLDFDVMKEDFKDKRWAMRNCGITGKMTDTKIRYTIVEDITLIREINPPKTYDTE